MALANTARIVIASFLCMKILKDGSRLKISGTGGLAPLPLRNRRASACAAAKPEGPLKVAVKLLAARAQALRFCMCADFVLL